VKRRASELIPPLLAQTVQQSTKPFVQSIFDLLRAQDGVRSGCAARRLGVRGTPAHCAGASKAAGDAVALAHSIRDHAGDLPEALAEWEQERNDHRSQHHGARSHDRGTRRAGRLK